MATQQPEPLFNLPASAPLPRAASLDRGGERPRWTRYMPKHRVPCDECVILLHENKGVGGYPLSARFTRSVTGKPSMRLCREHAELWKAEDQKK